MAAILMHNFVPCFDKFIPLFRIYSIPDRYTTIVVVNGKSTIEPHIHTSHQTLPAWIQQNLFPNFGKLTIVVEKLAKTNVVGRKARVTYATTLGTKLCVHLFFNRKTSETLLDISEIWFDTLVYFAASNSLITYHYQMSSMGKAETTFCAQLLCQLLISLVYSFQMCTPPNISRKRPLHLVEGHGFMFSTSTNPGRGTPL